MKKLLSILILSLLSCEDIQGSFLDLESRPTPGEELPNEFDWRDYGVVTPVKDQGVMGSCWAHAAVSVMESRYAIEGNPLTEFSPQQLIDCAEEDGIMQHNSEALAYFENHGPITEECAPYLMMEDSCSSISDCKEVDFRIAHGYRIAFDNNLAIKNSLLFDGPLSFSFYTAGFEIFWVTAKSGDVFVKTKPNKSPYSHQVLMVGYDDTKQAWLLQNSWGNKGPEDDGTFWLAYSGHIEDLKPFLANIKVGEHREWAVNP